jgi:hypothetical protein
MAETTKTGTGISDSTANFQLNVNNMIVMPTKVSEAVSSPSRPSIKMRSTCSVSLLTLDMISPVERFSK